MSEFQTAPFELKPIVSRPFEATIARATASGTNPPMRRDLITASLLPLRGGRPDRPSNFVERRAAACDAIGLIELQQTVAATVRDENAANVSTQVENRAVAWNERRKVRHAEGEIADRSSLDLDVDRGLRGSFQRLG